MTAHQPALQAILEEMHRFELVDSSFLISIFFPLYSIYYPNMGIFFYDLGIMG
jgi:hypothetical protein